MVLRVEGPKRYGATNGEQRAPHGGEELNETHRLPSIHPGEVLLEEFLLPLGITPYRLAKEIAVPQTRIAAILAGKRAVTADTALRLARYFETSPELWLNLQSTYELQEAQAESRASDVAQIRPYRECKELALR